MVRSIFSGFSVSSSRVLSYFLVSLPGLIAHTSMDQQSIQTLKDHIEGILKYCCGRFISNKRYMAKNLDDLFEKNYEATSAQYQREPL
jgi:hypothetical protein